MLAGMSAKWAFIDESKSNSYIVAAAVVESHSAPGIRKTLQGLRMKGQRRIHFSTESDARRKTLLSKISTFDCRYFVIESSLKIEFDARRDALSSLVAFLIGENVTTLVVELDESIQTHDRRTIEAVIRDQNSKALVNYRHESPFLECLLWLPDAVAWVSAKGDHWATRLNIQRLNLRP